MKIFNFQFSIFKYKYFLFFVCVFGFLFLVFCFLKEKKAVEIEPRQDLEKVTLAMGYIPNVQFAPFYVALDKGYFEQEGLEIEFNYGFETDIIVLLAKNELHFGIGSGEQVILARSQELPIVNFFNWYKRFPVCITSLAEKNIEKPTDLINKSVGIPAMQGASYIGWQALLEKNDLDEQQIQLKVIGYTQTASLTEDKIDAAVCYCMNEPIQLQKSGYQVNNIEVANYSNFVSNGLLSNEKTIKEKPQLVQKFTNAFLQGLKDTINNSDEAFVISKKYIPEMKEEEIQRAVLQESIIFWQAEKLGQNSSEQWQKSVELLKEFGLIEKKPAIETLFTNQFVE